jgi:hypothetical protein
MRTHRTHLLRALRRRRGDRGQAILEFAMVLPFLAALILIFVSFGKAVYYYIELTHAANEGARQAAVDAPDPSKNPQVLLPNGDTDLPHYLCQQFGTGSELYKGSGAVTPAKVVVSYSGGQAVGDDVKVSVSTSYSWFPFMNLGTFTITGSATMRLEQDTSANPKLANNLTATCS